MATEISENTQLKLDLKTIGIIVAGAISLASMYFVMAADIEKAKSYLFLRLVKLNLNIKTR